MQLSHMAHDFYELNEFTQFFGVGDEPGVEIRLNAEK
jgi:hypothetical protein